MAGRKWRHLAVLCVVAAVVIALSCAAPAIWRQGSSRQHRTPVRFVAPTAATHAASAVAQMHAAEADGGPTRAPWAVPPAPVPLPRRVACVSRAELVETDRSHALLLPPRASLLRSTVAAAAGGTDVPSPAPEPKACAERLACSSAQHLRVAYAQRRARIAAINAAGGFDTHRCDDLSAATAAKSAANVPVGVEPAPVPAPAHAQQPIRVHIHRGLHAAWPHIIAPVTQQLHACATACAVVADPTDAHVLFGSVETATTADPAMRPRFAHQKTAAVTLEPNVPLRLALLGVTDARTRKTSRPADMVLHFSEAADLTVNYWYGLSGDHWDHCTDEMSCLALTAPSTARFHWDIPADPQASQSADPDLPRALSPLFVSNCETEHRQSYLQQLIQLLPVDSYGKCFPNPSLQAVVQPGRAFKRVVSARYKFHFAFESTVLDDYVTEKFYQSFTFGAVPVVWGPPNAAAHAPGPNSFVNAMDFASPAALADHLVVVARNESLWRSYFAWRTAGFDPAFWRRRLRNFTAKDGDTGRSGESMICRVCALYRERYCAAI